MKLTGEEVLNAGVTMINLNNKPSLVIPMIAKKKLSIMWGIVRPVFETIAAQKDALIQTYGEEIFADAEKTKPTGQWSIPDEKSEKGIAFKADFEALKAGEYDFPSLTPIQFEMLGNDHRGLEVKDFTWLGKLVTDPKEA